MTKNHDHSAEVQTRPSYILTPPGQQIPIMTLRQWYAGQALAGLCANPYTTGWTMEYYTAKCIVLADALIVAEQGEQK